MEPSARWGLLNFDKCLICAFHCQQRAPSFTVGAQNRGFCGKTSISFFKSWIFFIFGNIFIMQEPYIIPRGHMKKFIYLFITVARVLETRLAVLLIPCISTSFCAWSAVVASFWRSSLFDGTRVSFDFARLEETPMSVMFAFVSCGGLIWWDWGGVSLTSTKGLKSVQHASRFLLRHVEHHCVQKNPFWHSFQF